MITDKNKFSQTDWSPTVEQPSADSQTSKFLTNFKGGNKLQRGGGWQLAGGGDLATTFLANSIAYSIIPTVNNTYALGSSSNKWANIYVSLINGVTPRNGSISVYVSDTSGGSPTHQLTFSQGILT